MNAARSAWGPTSRALGLARLLPSPCIARLTSLAPCRAITGAAPSVLGPQVPCAFHPGPTGLRGFASSTEVDDDDWTNRISYPDASAIVGKPAPRFSVPAVVDGEIVRISLDDTKGQWRLLFFYPKDFTYVCPTEITAFSDRSPDFAKLNCAVMAASCDTEETHLAWTRVSRNRGGLGKMQIPLLADTTKLLAAKYGVLMEDAGIALRGLFLIDPAGVLQHSAINNLGVGRSVDESLRLLQAFQFVAEHGEVCPAGWTPGAKTIVPTSEDSSAFFSSLNAEDDLADFWSAHNAIHNAQAFEKAVHESGPVLVEFYSKSCGKCRQLAPYVDALSKEFTGVKFHVVDSEAPELAAVIEKHDIKAVPSFLFFKGGKEAGAKITGYKKKMLREAVESLAN